MLLAASSTQSMCPFTAGKQSCDGLCAAGQPWSLLAEIPLPHPGVPLTHPRLPAPPAAPGWDCAAWTCLGGELDIYIYA